MEAMPKAAIFWSDGFGPQNSAGRLCHRRGAANDDTSTRKTAAFAF